MGTMEQWLDETVQLQVRNGSAEPVSIHRDQFRLLAPDGSTFSGRNSSTDPVEVAKGETRTIELTFSARGFICSQAMRLDPGAAITTGKSRVVLGSVSFVPSRAL